MPTRTSITEQDIWNLEERFWSKVDYSNVTGCWFWKGGLMSMGYGRLTVRLGLHILVHRMSWILYNGMIDASQCVCHRCDTPLCVNPDHLFLGTQAENNYDRHVKGRSTGPKGTQNPNHKLTPRMVTEIRRLYVPFKMSGPKLAKQFGVHSSTIYSIVNRTTWTKT
jgi:HNH endonuclease